MNTPTPTRVVAIKALAVLAFTLCASAQAQSVRKCQVDGRLVFQAAPCPVEARVVASALPRAAADLATAPKKRTLAEVLRERDGADRGRPQAREFQNDGATVLRARMGAV